jgi:hypothetical protein
MRRAVLVLMMLMATLLLSTSALADLSWTVNTPVNGSTIPGDMNELFNLDVNETVTSSFLYLNGAGPYAMTFSGMTANTTRDTVVLTEGAWYPFYFVTNGYISPTYTFYLDKVPLAPTWGGSPYTSGETFVDLDWNDNAEADIASYNVYRNGSNIGSSPTSDYTDNTVLVGEVWSYTVTAVDGIAQESPNSTAQVVLIQDSTPPAIPTISLPSPATYDTLTPTVNLSYGENVSLQVWSGSTMIQNIGWCVNCQWSPTFTSDGTYMFEFRAYDASSNQRNTSYTLIVDSVAINVTVYVADAIHLIGGDNPIVVKDTALSTVPNDYWMLAWDLSMYGGDYIRSTLDDMVSASQTIDVTGDSQPFTFCDEDYDSVNIDWDGTGSVYNVENTYNEGVNALTCIDTDPTGETQYRIYMKINVPGSLTSDQFDLDFEHGLYDTII